MRQQVSSKKLSRSLSYQFLRLISGGIALWTLEIESLSSYFFLEKSTLFFFILLLPFHPLPPRFIFIACFLHSFPLSFPLSFPFSSLSLIWLQTLFIAKVMFDYILQAFNTFIDDVFAFIIVMPTAHRLACFRDDVVFVIYLYQRW